MNIASASERDTFLQLLVTQLTYQDPLSPIQNEEFAAQLAQFSALEQLQQINATLSESTRSNQTISGSIGQLMAMTLIGKTVETASSVRGRVDGVSYSEEGILLSVDGQDVPLSDVTRITDR
jgi:flagellar basal-body rod modification protein FlgD